MSGSRWKAPGVRYTPAERAEKDRTSAAERNRQALRERQRDDEGHRLWAAGRLVPASITMVLNAAGLDGPQVDIDCGAVEPAVDEWEAGTLYPTWEQTQRLAALCGVTVAFLCHEHPRATGGFLCGPRVCTTITPRDQQLTFTPAALAARGTTISPGGLW